MFWIASCGVPSRYMLKKKIKYPSYVTVEAPLAPGCGFIRLRTRTIGENVYYFYSIEMIKTNLIDFFNPEIKNETCRHQQRGVMYIINLLTE